MQGETKADRSRYSKGRQRKRSKSKKNKRDKPKKKKADWQEERKEEQSKKETFLENIQRQRSLANVRRGKSRKISKFERKSGEKEVAKNKK